MPEQPNDNQPQPNDASVVAWTAPEFVAHDKSPSWFLGLAVVAIILSTIVFLISHDVVSVIVIIVVAIIFGVYGKHKPRELTYELNNRGIIIAQKAYAYDEFKSFSIKPDSGLLSLTFMPLKRFAPPLTIYYSPEQEEGIMKVLAARMPYEDPKRDAVDSLMNRIRF